MKNTFSYKRGKLILGYTFCIFFIFMAYIFFRGFLQLNEALSSIIWFLICIGALSISIYIWNETQVRIITNDDSILIKKLFNTITFNLDDVIEYGRDTYRTRTSNSWRYYVVLNSAKGKKIVVFREGLRDIKVISAYIIAKAKNARLVNIGPGRI
jgi:hypothetical protein